MVWPPSPRGQATAHISSNAHQGQPPPWAVVLCHAPGSLDPSAAFNGRLVAVTGDKTASPMGDGAGRQWDVALSFADTHRPYAQQVAAALKKRGVRCFYDADQQVRLWGTHRSEELPRIYRQESAAVVVFVSSDYAEQDWARLEYRAAFSRAVTEAGVYVLPARFDDSELPGLLPDVVCVDLQGVPPEEFADLVIAKLAHHGIIDSLLSDGGGHGPTRTVSRPAGAVRVGDADPRRLGVHPAIVVPGVADDTPPTYVERDVDGAEHGVRARLAVAAERGGFVLLVGGSSVGKTRTAYEAIQALLPDWWLVHPGGPEEVAALAARPPGRVVVWLDEIQRYLASEHGLTGGTIRRLLNAPGPVVIVGTVWPDWYPADAAPPGATDPYAREREVLDLADDVHIAPEFTAAERNRAKATAAGDRRLQAALEVAGYGLTQTLAAAPQLVARWEDARTAAPYAWAVLTAALDISWLGARTSLPADMLRAAAEDYCTSRQQAEAPADWFEQALAYATRTLRGAAAALSPVAAGMRRFAGYTVADYLLQHAAVTRCTAQVPASTWEALLTHASAADATTLARSAQNRQLYRYAIPLYRRAAEAGHRHAADRLADLLAKRGDLDEAKQILQALADTGDEDDAGIVAARLAEMLAEHDDLDGLRARTAAGDGSAACELAGMLTARGGDDDEVEQILRAYADNPDEGWAAKRLADLLAKRGDLDELRTRVDAGDVWAVFQLADLLADHGEFEEAKQILKAQADAGDKDDAGLAALRLAGMLAKHGDIEEAKKILRAQADAGYKPAAYCLVHLLTEPGALPWTGRIAFVGLLLGDFDGLHVDTHVDHGEAKRILKALADTGEWDAAYDLARLDGDLDEAERILRAQVDVGELAAVCKLTDLLVERGDIAGLRAQANKGDGFAAVWLTQLLVERGEIGELEDRAHSGDDKAADRLAGMLADLLDKCDLSEQAMRLRRFGVNPDGSIASGPDG